MEGFQEGGAGKSINEEKGVGEKGRGCEGAVRGEMDGGKKAGETNIKGIECEKRDKKGVMRIYTPFASTLSPLLPRCEEAKGRIKGGGWGFGGGKTEIGRKI